MMRLSWVITPLLVIGGIILFFGLFSVISILDLRSCIGLDDQLCYDMFNAYSLEPWLLASFIGFGITSTGIVLRWKKKTIEKDSEYSQYIDKSETNKNKKTESIRDRFTTFTIITTIVFTMSIILSVVPIWLKTPIPIITPLAGLPILPIMMIGGISGVGLYLVPIILVSLWVMVFLRSRVK